MAYLQQLETEISDTYVMTASLWFYAKSDECVDYGGGYFCEFGAAHPVHGTSFLGFDFSLGGGSTDEVSLSIGTAAGGARVKVYSPPPGTTPGTFYTRAADDFSDSFTGRISLGSGPLNPLKSNVKSVGTYRDKWVHCFMSIDLSTLKIYSTSSVGNVYAPTVNMWINGADQFTDVPSAFNYGLVADVGGALYQTDFPLDVHGNPSVNPISGGGYAPGNYYKIDPWKIPIAGHNIGLPLTGAFIEGHPRVRFADVQIWFDQCISPSDGNIRYFITDTGRPVSTRAAAKKFGPQTILFKGTKTGFSVNQGTGGSFTKAGTLSDFTPTPSG